MIIDIEDKLISTEIFDVLFCCDIEACKGICCVEGNSGAPLEEDEVAILERELNSFVPYMTPEGVEAIKKQGVMVVDSDGDLTTPLINDAECAYVTEDNGITFCAIEKAYLAGKTDFRKPISCHLYPIRVARFSNGTYGLNYHRWDVCDCALKKGRALNLPVYKMLKDPLIRRFGQEFYDQLESAAQMYNGLKD